RSKRDWSSDVCSSDLFILAAPNIIHFLRKGIHLVLLLVELSFCFLDAIFNLIKQAISSACGLKIGFLFFKLEDLFLNLSRLLLHPLILLTQLRSEEHTSQLQSRF